MKRSVIVSFSSCIRRVVWVSSTLLVSLVAAGAVLASELSSTDAHVRPIAPALQQLDTYVKGAMEKTGVPGVAVAVVYRDQVVYLKGFGIRRVGSQATVDSDTVFQLASVSKPIASTIIALLVGRGEVQWDNKIVDLDPSFALSDRTVTDQVTIRDMLSHRSGLPVLSGGMLEDLGFTRPQILHKLRLLPLTGEFRNSFQYSNFGFTEAGIAAAAAVGERWEDLAHDRLFEPLGMRATSYRYSDYANSINKAAIHVIADGKAIARYQRDPDAEAPAGGASASIRDLAQWLRLQLADGAFNGQQIVAADALKETHLPQIQTEKDPQGKPLYYGLGWNVLYEQDGAVELNHSGAFYLGASTAVRLSPADRLGIAVITNAMPTGLAEATAISFMEVYKAGKPSRDWLALLGEHFKLDWERDNNRVTDYSKLNPPTSVTPSDVLSAYAGTYRNEYYGEIEISVQHNVLWMRLPAKGLLYSLQHWDGNIFTHRIEGEEGVGTRGVEFFFDGTPRVKLDILALEGDGVFTRVNRSAP